MQSHYLQYIYMYAQCVLFTIKDNYAIKYVIKINPIKESLNSEVKVSLFYEVQAL